MRRRPQSHRPRPDRLAARIEHAAEEINPFLTVIAIGLVVLNLVALTFLAPRLSLSRGSAAGPIGVTPGPRLSGVAGLQ